MFRKPLLPGLVWTAFIAMLTLTPGDYIPRVTTFLDWLRPDKVVHLFIFSVYAYLLLIGFSKHNSKKLREHPVLISFVIGMIIAIFTEVMQGFVIHGRNGNIYDFIADMLGWLLGYALWHFTRRNDKKNLSTSKKYN